MQLRNLRYFAGVARTGSFSAAAELLHRSQPALSRAIQELEADLGVTLFTRHGRRISLSPEGWNLLRDAEAILGNVDALNERARRLRAGKAFVLRIGGAASTIERVLPRLIALYRAEWSSVEISITIDSGGKLLDAVGRGELDLAFTRLTTGETIESAPLFPVHVVAVVSKHHRLAPRKSVRVADLAQESLLVASKDFTSRMLFDAACKAAELRPRIILESYDHNALVALAAVDYGIAIVPSTVAFDDTGIKVLPLHLAQRPLGLWSALIWGRQERGRQQPPAHVAAFTDISIRALKTNYPGSALKLPALPMSSRHGANDAPNA